MSLTPEPGSSSYSPSKQSLMTHRRFMKIVSLTLSSFLQLGLFVNSIPSVLADDEYFGDRSVSYGSINVNIFSASPSAKERAEVLKVVQTEQQSNDEKTGTTGTTAIQQLQMSNTNTNDKNDIEKVLDLIPSWKYYKLIGKEYSRRNSGYQGGDDLLAPLL